MSKRGTSDVTKFKEVGEEVFTEVAFEEIRRKLPGVALIKERLEVLWFAAASRLSLR